jgi:hypothetical protein
MMWMLEAKRTVPEIMFFVGMKLVVSPFLNAVPNLRRANQHHATGELSPRRAGAIDLLVIFRYHEYLPVVLINARHKY